VRPAADGALGDDDRVDGQASSVGDAGPGAGAPGHDGGAPEPVDDGAPANAATGTGRRARRWPPGPRTPSFGLSLSAIRGSRPAAAEGTERLRRSLADQEAQTNELREALDALRQALDDTTPVRADAGGPPRRRRRGLVVAGIAGAAVVGIVAGAVVLGDDGDVTTAPVAPSAAPSAPSSVPSAAPSGATSPMDWRGGPVDRPPGLVSSGPGVTTPGTDVTAAIDDDLVSVDVYERVRLATPAPQLRLSLPATSAWPGDLARLRPQVTQLQVEVDGSPAQAREADGGWLVVAPPAATIADVVLRYKVTGVMANFDDGPGVRRLVAIPSLTGRTSLDAGLPVTTRVTDPRIEDAFCITADARWDLCASEADGTFTMPVPAGGSPVGILQADVRPL
jgi:hypothetical protein